MKYIKNIQLSYQASLKNNVTMAVSLLAILFLGVNIAHAGGGHEHHHDKKTEAKKAHQHGKHHDHGQHKSQVGKPAAVNEADKTIQVIMLDSMQYEFDQELHIHRNEVVRFIVTNKGKITHEFSIGNSEEQRKHAEMMRKMPDMKHEDGNTLSLNPGESGEIIWRFQGDTAIVFACNIPGHFEAGMFTTVTVKTHH